MANLGICSTRKCPRCSSFRPAMVDEEGNMCRRSYVECDLARHGTLGWKSKVPDGCPYLLEHKLSEDSVAEMDTEEDEEDDA